MPAYDKYLKDSAAPAPAPAPAYAKYLETPQAGPAREEVEVGNAYSKALGYGNKYTGNPEQVAAYKKEQEAHPIKTFMGLGRAPEEFGLSGPPEGMKTWRDPVSDYYKVAAKTGIGTASALTGPFAPAVSGAGTGLAEGVWSKTGAGNEGESTGEAVSRGIGEGLLTGAMPLVSKAGGALLGRPAEAILGSGRISKAASLLGRGLAPEVLQAGVAGRLPTAKEAVLGTAFEAIPGGAPRKAKGGLLSKAGEYLQKPEKLTRANKALAAERLVGGQLTADELAAKQGLVPHDIGVEKAQTARAQAVLDAQEAKASKIATDREAQAASLKVAEEQLAWKDRLEQKAREAKTEAKLSEKAGEQVAFDTLGERDKKTTTTTTTEETTTKTAGGHRPTTSDFEFSTSFVRPELHTNAALEAHPKITTILNEELGANFFGEGIGGGLQGRNKYMTRKATELGPAESAATGQRIQKRLAALFLGDPQYAGVVPPELKTAFAEVATGQGSTYAKKKVQEVVSSQLYGKVVSEELKAATRTAAEAKLAKKRQDLELSGQGLKEANLGVEEAINTRRVSPEMQQVLEAKRARAAQAGKIQAAQNTRDTLQPGEPAPRIGFPGSRLAGLVAEPLERGAEKVMHATGTILKALDTAPPGVQAAMEPFRRAAPRGADAARAALYLLAQQNPEVRAWLREHRQQSQGE